VLTILALLVGIAAGIVIQARRAAKATGTSIREQIQLNGGPPPVRPK